MKKFLSLVVLTGSFASVFSQQTDFTSMGRGTSTTFVTDYHTTGINPANLGFKRKYESKHVTFGLFETGFTAYSGALEKKEFRNSLTDFGSEDFTYEQKMKAAAQFAGENMALNVEMNWLGVSYQNDKIGGFSFNIRETGRWFSTFNDNLSKILFLGYRNNDYFDQLLLNNGMTVANDPSMYADYESQGGIKKGIKSIGAQYYSQLFEGSRVSMLLYREYALNYGKELKITDNFSIAGGAGIKYLQGYGVMDIQVKDGKMTSFGAFSPAFGVDFGNASMTNPSADTSNGYRSVGSGLGMDLGFNIYYKEKIKLGFAFTNIGSITWKGNVYTAQDTVLYDMESEGFDGYNVFQQAGDIASDEGLFKWQGAEKLKTRLPTTFRIGISHQLEDKGEVGIDVIIPLNDQPGTIQKPYWAIGGDFRIFRFLRLSSGLAYGGNFDKRLNIPLGVTFVIGEQASWEIGFASRDAITYFRQEGPAISFAFGFLRFRV